MIKFAIIDDEPCVVKNLSHLLESIFIKYDYDANVCFETSNGLEIAEKVRKTNKNCYLIFITAYTEYGLEAFKYKTFDFISKPVESKHIETSINRLFEDINGLPRKFIKIDSKNTIIDEHEIKFIERDGMKLVFHTSSRDYEVYSSFNKIKEKLPENFVRCHKSYIENIVKVEPSKNLVYFNNSHCDIGPKYKPKFMEVIGHNEAIKEFW